MHAYLLVPLLLRLSVGPLRLSESPEEDLEEERESDPRRLRRYPCPCGLLSRPITQASKKEVFRCVSPLIQVS